MGIDVSRVIKFRAYCPRLKQMSNNSITIETMAEHGTKASPDGLIWLQFTGLTDKNGVEICEGDIVSAFCNINKISDPHLTEREPMYDLKVVKKMKGSFVLSTEKYSFCGVLGFSVATMPDDLTVVGNIYENPELLDHSSESP